MKILHIGLADHFTDNMLYQDNILTDLNAKAGHDVVIISDCFMFKDGELVKTEECDTLLDNGVRLIRLSYDRIINDFVSEKIQKAHRTRKLLREIKPDAILYHGVCGYELMDTAKYAKKKGIPFYIDSHENFKNTAMTPVSKFAYKYIHGIFVKKALPVAWKILYVGTPEKEYLMKMYKIPKSRLEFFPLGGILLSEEEQIEYRKKMIKERDFPEDAIICAHSGKMDKGKKTEDVIKAFSGNSDPRLRLLIFGQIPDIIKPVLEPLIAADDRISFLGWKTADEQKEILGATDLYMQPGTYSATAQNALCHGCAVILNRDYEEIMNDAPYYEETEDGIARVLKEITADRSVLENRKNRCFKLAADVFDYEKMAERYLH